MGLSDGKRWALACLPETLDRKARATQASARTGLPIQALHGAGTGMARAPIARYVRRHGTRTEPALNGIDEQAMHGPVQEHLKA